MRGPAAVVPCGVDQQQSANGRSLMVEHVAKARETIGHLAQGQCAGAPPSSSRASGPQSRASKDRRRRQDRLVPISRHRIMVRTPSYDPIPLFRQQVGEREPGERIGAVVRRGNRRPACVRSDEPEFRSRSGPPSCASCRYPWCPNARYPLRSEIGLVRLLTLRARGLERVARCDAMYSSQLR